MSKLLNVENLNVKFSLENQTIHAVRSISFFVDQGEILAIVGESGSGKTTLARSVMRLLDETGEITASSIEFSGEDLLEKTEPEFRKIRGKDIAMIFQDSHSSLNPTMSIGEQIRECVRQENPSLPYKEQVQSVLKLIEEVHLGSPKEVYHLFPFQLSGGMKQRVLIAMAFAFVPRLIIADEPTSSLDGKTQVEILSLMEKMRTLYDTSILLITHDLNLVARYAHRVCVMYSGRIIETGSTAEVFSHPKHPYTQLLLKSMPRKNFPVLPSIDGTSPDLSKIQYGCPFFARCPHAMRICEMSKPKIHFHTSSHSSYCWIYAHKPVHAEELS